MNVPVSVAARVYKKDPAWVRAGIITGYLPIGIATRDGKKITSVDEMDSKLGKISYYISPKLFYEHTGVQYPEEENFEKPLSNRNKELLYFCRQYPEWKEKMSVLGSNPTQKKSPVGKSDITFSKAQARMYYGERIKMVNDIADSFGISGPMIFEYVTTETTASDITHKYHKTLDSFMVLLFSFFDILGEKHQ